MTVPREFDGAHCALPLGVLLNRLQRNHPICEYSIFPGVRPDRSWRLSPRVEVELRFASEFRCRHTRSSEKGGTVHLWIGVHMTDMTVIFGLSFSIQGSNPWMSKGAPRIAYQPLGLLTHMSPCRLHD